MTRKSRRKKIIKKSQVDVTVTDQIPIPNLPNKFLWMHVNSGTKIRNVLNYALKEFPGHKSVVWSGAGQGIGKVITCAEICKKKNPGLHQITKLRYVKSKKSDTENADNSNHSVPEIHIFLSKDPLDPKVPGYQSSLNPEEGLFLSRKSAELFPPSETTTSNLEDKNNTDEINKSIEKEKKTVLSQETSTANKLSNLATEEFAAMGLRTGQKRAHKSNERTTETERGTSSGDKNRKKGKK